MKAIDILLRIAFWVMSVLAILVLILTITKTFQ